MQSVIFQHDGAPPHYSIQARDFISSQLPHERIIGRGFGHAWPARSPDLSPLDFYLWSTLKSRVYHTFIPANLDDLKRRITQEVDALNTSELYRAVQNMIPRCELIIQQNGGLIEHLF